MATDIYNHISGGYAWGNGSGWSLGRPPAGGDKVVLEGTVTGAGMPGGLISLSNNEVDITYFGSELKTTSLSLSKSSITAEPLAQFGVSDTLAISNALLLDGLSFIGAGADTTLNINAGQIANGGTIADTAVGSDLVIHTTTLVNSGTITIDQGVLVAPYFSNSHTITVSGLHSAAYLGQPSKYLINLNYNNGVLQATNGAAILLSGVMVGTGTIDLKSGGRLYAIDFYDDHPTEKSHQTIDFGGEAATTFTLDFNSSYVDRFSFANFAPTDIIDIANLNASFIDWSSQVNPEVVLGDLMHGLTESLSFAGNYSGYTFGIRPDGAGGTDIYVLPKA